MGRLRDTIKVAVNVVVKHRKFISDPSGPVSVGSQRGRYTDWTTVQTHNLNTDAGIDFLHTQGYATSGIGTDGANFIALSSDTGAPDASDTTLTGEITTGGLERQQASASHVAGSTTTGLIKTFVASTAHTAVQKAGLFTAASGGTMVHEVSFTPFTLNNLDQIQINWTITLS